VLVEEGVVIAPGSAGKERKLTNQFNYSDRASLTYNNPLRVRIFNLFGETINQTINETINPVVI